MQKKFSHRIDGKLLIAWVLFSLFKLQNISRLTSQYFANNKKGMP